MFVQPKPHVSDKFASVVEAGRNGRQTSCLDQPTMAAQHLKTQEDLCMFYGREHDADALGLAAFLVTKVAVAVGAIAYATVNMAVNGPGVHAKEDLLGHDYFGEEDVAFFDLDALLSARQDVLAN